MTTTIDAFEAYLAHIRAQTQVKKDAVGDMSQGGIVRQATGDRCAFVLPDMGEPGEPGRPGNWRIQYFDDRGFSGHGLYANADEALEAAIGSGFVVRDDLALDRAQTLASFWRGNHAADLIRRINNGELNHAQADALLADYDAQVAGQPIPQPMEAPRV